MDRHAHPQIAARTADRMCGRDAARVTREERADAQIQQHAQADTEAAVIAAGIAGSETDADLQALLADAAGTLDGLPEIVPDPDFDADADADAAWLRQCSAGWILHAIARRRLLTIAAGLRQVDAAALPEIAPEHQRQAHLSDILARAARARLAALIHARLRVIHVAAIARLARAGRSSAATSAAPACLLLVI